MSINAGLVTLLIISVPLACGIGAVEVYPGIILRIVLEHLALWQRMILPPPSPADESITRGIRFPRTLVGAACGAGLAVIGLTVQPTLRNVLADPYILGIPVGASTGAAIIMAFGLRMANSPVHVGVGAGAFIGSLASFVLVMTLARGAGRLANTRVIFAGMTVNFFFFALTSLIVMLAKDSVTTRSVVFWMLSSPVGSRWLKVATAMGASGAGILGLIVIDRRIDALPLGDDAACTLGVDPQRQCFPVFLLISLIVAFLVASTGMIGFTGLAVPHLMKRLHGRIFRRSAPACAVIGVIITVLADLLARIAIAPGEMSIGVITSLLGVPLFMFLIGRDARNEG